MQLFAFLSLTEKRTGRRRLAQEAASTLFWKAICSFFLLACFHKSKKLPINESTAPPRADLFRKSSSSNFLSAALHERSEQHCLPIGADLRGKDCSTRTGSAATACDRRRATTGANGATTAAFCRAREGLAAAIAPLSTRARLNTCSRP